MLISEGANIGGSFQGVHFWGGANIGGVHFKGGSFLGGARHIFSLPMATLTTTATKRRRLTRPRDAYAWEPLGGPVATTRPPTEAPSDTPNGAVSPVQALVRALAADGPGGSSVSRTMAGLWLAVSRAKDKVNDEVWDLGHEALVAVLTRGSPMGRTNAAKALAALARRHEERLAMLASSLKVLVKLAHSHGPTECQSAAVTLIHLITAGNEGRCAVLFAAGGIGPLVALAQTGSQRRRHRIVAILCNLTTDPLQRDAVAAQGGLSVMLAALHISHNCAAVAALAIANLCTAHEQRSSVVADAGGIERLMRLFRTAPGNREATRRALDSLATSPERMLRIAAAQVLETQAAYAYG
jgi:hypothetical protein